MERWCKNRPARGALETPGGAPQMFCKTSEINILKILTVFFHRPPSNLVKNLICWNKNWIPSHEPLRDFWWKKSSKNINLWPNFSYFCVCHRFRNDYYQRPYRHLNEDLNYFSSFQNILCFSIIVCKRIFWGAILTIFGSKVERYENAPKNSEILSFQSDTLFAWPLSNFFLGTVSKLCMVGRYGSIIMLALIPFVIPALFCNNP